MKKGVELSIALVLVLMLHFSGPRAGAQSANKDRMAASTAGPTLDYEFFKTRVEPIFLKKRPTHARCYVCHEVSRHGGGPLSLERMPSGTSTWTEEQSRANFQTVSKLVTPGNPLQSLLLLMPLAPEVDRKSVV